MASAPEPCCKAEPSAASATAGDNFKTKVAKTRSQSSQTKTEDDEAYLREAMFYMRQALDKLKDTETKCKRITFRLSSLLHTISTYRQGFNRLQKYRILFEFLSLSVLIRPFPTG